MSKEEKIIRADFEALTDEEIVIAKEVIARREVEALAGTPWGECVCGRMFNMLDKMRLNYCPECGRELIKDE